MKRYIIPEDLLEETIQGLRLFGSIAVADTVEKLQQLNELNSFESIYQKHIHEGYEGSIMRPSMNPYNSIGK